MNTTAKVIISIAATALVVGAGTYYFVNRSAAADKEALQSNIDDLNKKVAQLEKSVAASVTPTATASSTPTSAATPDQKTYSNTAYNYSFKYPSTVELYSTVGMGRADNPIAPTSESVHVKKSGVNLIEIKDISSSLDLTDYINSNWTTANKVVTETTVAGTKGYKVVISGSDYYYYVEKNGKKLEIELNEKDATAKEIFNSFSFTK